MKSKKLFYIGLSAVIALAFIVWGIDFLKGKNLFHSSNYYFVSLDNVSGLTVSSPVTANGLKVGQVREMTYEYDNPGHVCVELALDNELKITQGTQAKLTTDLLGTASIVLEIPVNKPTIAVGSTIEGGVNSSLVDQMQTSVMPILPKVDSLVAATTALVSNPALIATLNRLDQISQDLNTVSATLAASSKQLPMLLSSANTAMTDAKTVTGNLNTFTSSLNRMPLQQTVENLEQFSASLKQISATLEGHNSSLGMLINDPALYNNLNATVNSLDSLVVDIKAHPKRYLKFSVF